MKKVTTYGNVENGKLKASKWDVFKQNILAFGECRIRITAEKLYSKRSNQQNRYYWGVVVNEFVDGMSEMWGEKITAETAHEMMKLHCNGKDVVNPETGEIMTIPQSTQELDTYDFEQYQERCRKLIFDYFGRTVPLPNEQSTMNLE